MFTHLPAPKQPRLRLRYALAAIPTVAISLCLLSTVFVLPSAAQDAASTASSNQNANSAIQNDFGFPWREHNRSTRLVGYLPDYDGSYADFAKTLDFSKMTHLYLAFGNPPFCTGTCTEASDMQFSLGQTDTDIKTLVDKAHREGVKVVLSIGGGGGDQQILQFYNAGLSKQLVRSLNNYIRQHNLDGVDLDIEDPNNMGIPYETFTRTLIETFHPQGMIVTAAVAEYLQDSMPDRALHMFDFINIMNYSNDSDAIDAINYYHEMKNVPKDKMTLGVPFFGQSSDGNTEETYSTILAAYPDAWKTDSVSGGALDNGEELFYVGEATMARETRLGKEYGGVMIWELSQDAPAPYSLMHVIDDNL